MYCHEMTKEELLREIERKVKQLTEKQKQKVLAYLEEEGAT